MSLHFFIWISCVPFLNDSELYTNAKWFASFPYTFIQLFIVFVCRCRFNFRGIQCVCCFSLYLTFPWYVLAVIFSFAFCSSISISLQRNEKKHSRRGYNNLVDKSFILVGTEHEKHYSPTHNMKWIENVCSCDVWKFVSFVRIEDLCECSNSFKTMHSFNRLCNGMKNVIRYSFVYRLLASASDSFCLHFF